jgi:predicted glycosyltransferase
MEAAKLPHAYEGLGFLEESGEPVRTSWRRGAPKNRVLFYCQHLMGMGHLVRSAAIVHALAADFSVHFVTGGLPVAGFTLPPEVHVIQLPPLQSDDAFDGLQVCESSASLQETQCLRRERLLHVFDSVAPDVLITELYPFGRKQFEFELIPLLERSQRRSGESITVSSIRDVLVTKKNQPRHEQRVREIINRYYDLVLIHGDERLHRLEETFSSAGQLTCPLRYTGYVVQPEDRPVGMESVRDEVLPRPTIVVSVGGGRSLQCHELLTAVMRAAIQLEGRIPHRFCMFAGPLVPPEIYADLEALARTAGNVQLRRYTPGLRIHMKHAALSLSMAGYNTVMDIISTGVPALVFPVTTNEDREQSIRAAALEKLGVVEMLRSEDLKAERLAAEIVRALEITPRRLSLDFGGARNTALVLREFLRRRNEGRLGAGVESAGPDILNNSTSGRI